MSNAKWCDSCSSIFPEGVPGSESGVGRITINDERGVRTVDQVRDWCPVCVSVRHSTQQRFDPREYQHQISTPPKREERGDPDRMP